MKGEYSIFSFADINRILHHKLDVIDDKGKKIDFVDFINFSLMDIKNILDDGNWRYRL